jgi:hypothetical protein
VTDRIGQMIRRHVGFGWSSFEWGTTPGASGAGRSGALEIAPIGDVDDQSFVIQIGEPCPERAPFIRVTERDLPQSSEHGRVIVALAVPRADRASIHHAFM